MGMKKMNNILLVEDSLLIKDGSYNLTYFSQMGKWNLKEGLELWKQKL